MELRDDFIQKISHLNGKKVELTIFQITKDNHPLGLLGAMLMGQEQIERIRNADVEYSGQNGITVVDAIMEMIPSSDGYYLMFIANNSNCNCIEIFRPEPPMEIEGIDMSLWWSYHPLSQLEIDKTKIISKLFKPSISTLTGDCHPIREILVNQIRHCI